MPFWKGLGWAGRSDAMGDLLILLSAVLFGFSPILIKVAYSYGVTPLTVLALRYAIATILFWGGVAVLGVRLHFPRHAILVLVAMGLTLVPVQIFSFLLALAYLPASSASVLAYVYPLHVAGWGGSFSESGFGGKRWPYWSRW